MAEAFLDNNAFFDNSEKFLLEEHLGYSQMNVQHFHEQMEIYYLKQGEIAYFVEEATYTIREGDVIILPPAVIHKTVDPNQMPRQRVLINLRQEFMDEIQKMGFPAWKETAIFHTVPGERIRLIFDELIEEDRGRRDPILLKALLCELLVRLQRKTEIKNSVEKDGIQSKQISEILAYINQNYMADLTLQNLSEYFYLNPSYLSRVFKKCTGMVFSDYLRKYRVKKSLDHMAVGGKNITQIAMDVGFHSTNHFCKTFREIIGESPLQYMKRQFPNPGEINDK